MNNECGLCPVCSLKGFVQLLPIKKDVFKSFSDISSGRVKHAFGTHLCEGTVKPVLVAVALCWVCRKRIRAAGKRFLSFPSGPDPLQQLCESVRFVKDV